MNVYITKEIQEKWPTFDFRGKIRKSKHGFEYMEAYHKVLQDTFFYVFGADSFVDVIGIKCGASELIFKNGPIV